MASLLPAYNLCPAILPCKKARFSQPLQVKAQSYRDHHHEGRSNDIVGANLHLLRMRIEEGKNKERLERCFLAEQGWNYVPLKSFKSKRNKKMINEFLQLVGVVVGTLGLTILSCSFCLCVVSFLVHLNQ